jgi:hypothetical protein
MLRSQEVSLRESRDDLTAHWTNVEADETGQDIGLCTNPCAAGSVGYGRSHLGSRRRVFLSTMDMEPLVFVELLQPRG